MLLYWVLKVLLQRPALSQWTLMTAWLRKLMPMQTASGLTPIPPCWKPLSQHHTCCLLPLLLLQLCPHRHCSNPRQTHSHYMPLMPSPSCSII